MASSDSAKAYIFNRDYRSSVRLNLNHWITKGLTGYLLHPKVAYPENAVIADIGTGTAIWLQELAEQIPSPAKLYGFDSSPEQYPASQWEHIGKYDVVHIRFLRCLVKNNNPEPLLKNLMTLLKPGGYLQWFDVLGSEAHVETKNTSAKTQATEQLAKMSLLPSPELPADWVKQLPETFANNGLKVITADHIPYRDAYRLPWGQSMLVGIEDMSTKGSDEKAKQAQGWIGALSEELAQGVLMEHPSICVVGQKEGD